MAVSNVRKQSGVKGPRLLHSHLLHWPSSRMPKPPRHIQLETDVAAILGTVVKPTPLLGQMWQTASLPPSEKVPCSTQHTPDAALLFWCAIKAAHALPTKLQLLHNQPEVTGPNHDRVAHHILHPNHTNHPISPSPPHKGHSRSRHSQACGVNGVHGVWAAAGGIRTIPLAATPVSFCTCLTPTHAYAACPRPAQSPQTPLLTCRCTAC